MRMMVLATAASLMMVSSAWSQEHKELGPHQHGSGRLNIAIEGNTVEMELDTPGADIIGFEHAAETDQQKAALAAGLNTLRDALTLYKLPAAAGCTVITAEAKIEGDEPDAAAGATAAKPEAAHDGHSDINAAYKLQCRAIEQVRSIDFGYFAAFPKAQKLQVTIVTAKGQQEFEVSRDKPSLSLAGII
jgi:hypothetical protein